MMPNFASPELWPAKMEIPKTLICEVEFCMKIDESLTEHHKEVLVEVYQSIFESAQYFQNGRHLCWCGALP